MCGVKRHADARKRGMKRVQIEPHLSVTGACSAEWMPIKPKTDRGLPLRHDPRAAARARARAARPAVPQAAHLVALSGRPERLLPARSRTRASRWSSMRPPAARCRSTPLASIRRSKARLPLDGIEIGPDDEVTRHRAVTARPSFGHLVDHVAACTPEWAGAICDVEAGTIRRDRQRVPRPRTRRRRRSRSRARPCRYRPVAISLGKTVNNGWGGFECCWARTLLACLVGALEVPGGTIGTTVRLNRPADNRWSSVTPGPDGFMHYPLNPTGKADWPARAQHRATRIARWCRWPPTRPVEPGARPDPSRLDDAEGGFRPGCRAAPPPDVWFVYRTNPAISFWDTAAVGRRDGAVPVHRLLRLYARRDQPLGRRAAARLHRPGEPAAPAHRRHEIHRAVLGPPGLRAAPSGGRRRRARRATSPEIATELARRTGLLEPYNAAINRGAAGVKLSGANYDFSLEANRRARRRDDLGRHLPRGERRADRRCGDRRARLVTRARLPATKPFPRLQWYLYPDARRARACASSCRTRSGCRASARSSAGGCTSTACTWWDRQLEEYQPLPHWRDLPAVWEGALARHFGVTIGDYPFWLSLRAACSTRGAATSACS